MLLGLLRILFFFLLIRFVVGLVSWMMRAPSRRPAPRPRPREPRPPIVDVPFTEEPSGKDAR